MKSSVQNVHNELTNRITNLLTVDPSLLNDKNLLRQSISNQVEEILNYNQKTQDQNITILLSDIRGFTALSEKYKAIDIVNMLNNYFMRMNQVIDNYGGVIDKYMGDAIMVLFGAEESEDNNVLRAVACAVDMQISMDEVNKANANDGLPELFMGIGINTGLVSAGRVGSILHNEYTVIGDGVNLASRIESHSLRGQILISEHSHKLTKNHIEVGVINKVRVKGKTEMVRLYEVLSTTWPKPLEVPKREIRTSPRVDVDIEFNYQLIEGKSILPDTLIGHIKDMSYYGMFAIFDAEPELLSNIKLSLALSIMGERKDIYAKIMSINKVPGGYGCGIEYTALDDDSVKAIKDFIDRILEGK